MAAGSPTANLNALQRGGGPLGTAGRPGCISIGVPPIRVVEVSCVAMSSSAGPDAITRPEVARLDPADRPLKIGLVSDCYVPRLGGIEMQVHDLAQQLQRAGHDVVVITPTPGPDLIDGIRVHRMQVPLLPFDIPFTPATFRQVSELLRRERVDVAHFHGGIASPLAFIGAASAQADGVPTVITTHCLWSYAAPIFGLLDRRIGWTRWPVVLSAVSDVAAAPIRKIGGPGLDVAVVPNGIENAAWVVTPVPRDAGTVTIVSVMRLAPRKRPRHLLKMIAQVREQMPSDIRLRVVVIGEGPERRSLEKFLQSHDLSEVVELVGRRSRDEIRDEFARADIFVAPANLESFGIAALEARCAGLPVVAKGRTGIREFVANGQEGLLAQSDRDMVDQLLRLIREPALRQRIAAHNRTVPSSVDWSRVVEANLAVYRRAIALRGGLGQAAAG
jgi:glycosyltransferase involved in cell wall biosynthesis